METEKTTQTDKTKKEASPFERLWEAGLPIYRAIFKGSVNNADNTPNSEWNSTSSDPSRRVEMRLIAQGILGRHKDKWILVPTSFAKQIDFKK